MRNKCIQMHVSTIRPIDKPEDNCYDWDERTVKMPEGEGIVKVHGGAKIWQFEENPVVECRGRLPGDAEHVPLVLKRGQMRPVQYVLDYAVKHRHLREILCREK